ncbi:DUF5994 family protein [Streptomyces sp. B6B3]|uniref:DUF5994 family protein n=1 Tax=Streptomyces sp. B6B3 TaxID=3153570 RepID=UPI00325DE0FD
MSATTDFLAFPGEHVNDSPARLQLKDADAHRGLLDGAWWPRSRDLSRELPVLAQVLDPRWGRVTRIAVNPRFWPVIPRKVAVHGHVIKVGWFSETLDPHQVLLRSYAVGRWDLLVVPPQASAASAARLMAAACDTAEPLSTASTLVADEESRRDVSTVDRLEDPVESWEHEGGASGTRPASLATGLTAAT